MDETNIINIFLIVVILFITGYIYVSLRRIKNDLDKIYIKRS